MLINFAYFVSLFQTCVNFASTNSTYLVIRSSLHPAGEFIHQRTLCLRPLVCKRKQDMRENCLVSAALYGPCHHLRRDDQLPRAFTTVVSYKMSPDLPQSALLVLPGLELSQCEGVFFFLSWLRPETLD